MTEHLLYAAAINFEAARQVDLLPEGHRSRRLHGHSFLANVRVALPNNWADFQGGEVVKLRERLVAAVSPLDYAHLNGLLDQPTDENLSRWVRARLDLEGIDAVGIQSTQDEGVDLSSNDHAHIWRRYLLQSAHQLPNVPLGHKCGRMHGHGFEVILHADQDLGGREIGIDYDCLDKLWAPINAELNFACLNDIPGLENPTSEVISRWIWQRLKPELPELSWVTVYETASCGAHFDGTHHRIWKEMTLDSSVCLKHAPVGDPRRRIHGHTYTLRLHLHAPLDEVMGWTVDFGDVKEIFNPVFKQLDHHPLHEIVGDHDADTASLAKWIREQTQPNLSQLDRIDLYETKGCGVILSWGAAGPALPI
ncbi:6-carboxytetrahydropterin synthase [Noviherbaspirillum massiliense]|uniref:6-carboxytetrahydropterin synthase n=1 Tax=Noviherbaspirillum massiliense TaxID=1465823 RepID=UPI0002F528A1|nr:6-carboxytetrahydropterin synthase [Noviherbaspirillum massiliense]